MTSLGTLGGSFAAPNGINDKGQITGYSLTSGNATHAFLYSDSKWMDLGTLGGSESLALGINNLGQVVGYASTAAQNFPDTAFLYSGGVMFDLNSLIDTNSIGTVLTSASGINDSGQIIAEGANDLAYLLTPAPEPSALTLAILGAALCRLTAKRWRFTPLCIQKRLRLRC